MNMAISPDDPALDELVTRAARGEVITPDQLGSVLDELRSHRKRSARLDSMREDQAALMQLARSEALGSGDLRQALREITETAAQILGVARASVWRYEHDRSAIVCLDLYRAAPDVHESGAELARVDFPGYFQALLDERTIPAHDAHTDPRTAEFTDSYLRPLGIASMLDAPVHVGDEMVGVICNEHTGRARVWTPFDELCACALADFTALALNSERRLRVEDELRSMVEVAEQRLRTIERQRMTIADLSAPIIDVWDGILALPIIGPVDHERSIELTERLLARIASSRARAVIVDVTGVDTVDTKTADYLLQMVRAAKLLGTTCVLSGISPKIAQTLVMLQIDLAEITTVRDLQHALRICLLRRNGAPA